MSLAESLREMGFNEKMIMKAINKSKADTLEQAIEWIIQNQDRDLPSDDDHDEIISKTSLTNNSTNESSEPKKAKTQEELDQEKKRVEELIKKRKQEREEEERREQIEREKSRRKTGNEIVQIREKMEHEERIRAAQEMRRDRVEREEQRKKILEEIKRDREQMKRQSTNGDSTTTRPVTLASQFESSSSNSSGSASYDSCRVAIRLPNGSNLLQTFQATEQLCAVRLFVQLNRKDLEPEVARQSRFNMMMPPSRTFTDEDMEKSLKDLGLCPSSRIIIVDRKD